MILSDGTCVSKGRRTRTRKIKGNCGTNASFKSFISIEMQLWLPLSFASLLTISLGLTALLRTLPGTTCVSEAGITQTRRILASCGTSTTTTGLHSFQNLDSNQKSPNVWSDLEPGTFVFCSTYLPQVLALPLQLLSWHSLTGFVSQILFKSLSNIIMRQHPKSSEFCCGASLWKRISQIIILQKFMNAMRPTIRYIAADRHKGIANVQFVVSSFCNQLTKHSLHFLFIPLHSWLL